MGEASGPSGDAWTARLREVLEQRRTAAAAGPEPIDGSTGEPAADLTNEPAAEPTTELTAGEPSAEAPAAWATTEPIAGPTTEPAAEPPAVEDAPAAPSPTDVPGVTARRPGRLVPLRLPDEPGHRRRGRARPRHARRRSRGLRALSWVSGVLVLVLLLVAGAGALLVRHYNGNIDRIDVLGGGGRGESAMSGPQTVLLVGSDSRDGLTGEDAFQGTGDEFVTGQRSDTIILAHLYGSSAKAQLISLPRDSWVTIPAWTDPKTGRTTAAHEGKINSSFTEGGPPLLLQTVEALSGLTVDHYVQVDFTGFKGMVDALGGVEVCLPTAEKEERSGIDLPAGKSVVSGDQALAFVRQRHGLARSDLDRIDRQQRFLGSMLRTVLSRGTLLSPTKLNSFLNVATQSLTLDEQFGLGDLRTLALRFRKVDASDVLFTTAPVADLDARRGTESVVLLDDAALTTLFDQVAKDELPVPPPPLTVQPADVPVEVLNGSGISGLATRATEDLVAQGFDVQGKPGNREGSAPGTVVEHAPDQLEAARTLAAAVPGAQLRELPDHEGPLSLVLGVDYSGVQPVAVGTAPPPALTAAADPCSV